MQEITREQLISRAAELLEDGWRASVAPAMLPDAHPLACVNDVFNAVMVHGDRVDDVMLILRADEGHVAQLALREHRLARLIAALRRQMIAQAHGLALFRDRLRHGGDDHSRIQENE